jgi:hypothetical protein
MVASHNLLALNSVAALFAYHGQVSSKPLKENIRRANATLHRLSYSGCGECEKGESKAGVKERHRVLLCVGIDQSSRAKGAYLVLT